jgi:hypothetical protein
MLPLPNDEIVVSYPYRDLFEPKEGSERFGFTS